MQITEIFFDKLKDPRKAQGNFENKVSCIEKLGGVIPAKLQTEFFEHFDKFLGQKLERPVKKGKNSSIATD